MNMIRSTLKDFARFRSGSPRAPDRLWIPRSDRMNDPIKRVARRLNLEEGATQEIFNAPRNAYTRALIEATPKL